VKRFLKWTLVSVVVGPIVGLFVFLYFVPPFDATSPEEYVRREASAAPTVDHIKDPAARRIAERGRYLVVTAGCNACHVTPGPQGPVYDMFLAGGMKMVHAHAGTAFTRNLTPDAETGLGKWTDDRIKLALRSGTRPDGRQMFHRHMPWPAFSAWSEEDRHAVVTYLRALHPIRHRIPDRTNDTRLEDPGSAEAFYLLDYGTR
jgi:hypothetical protein